VVEIDENIFFASGADQKEKESIDGHHHEGEYQEIDDLDVDAEEEQVRA
jgi:hypothetical protein